MASLAFASFSFEAFLNYLGLTVIQDWDRIERKLGMEEKLALISAFIDFKLDKGKRPYQSVHQIGRFRNDLVHPKYSGVEVVEGVEISDDGFINFETLPSPSKTKYWDLAKDSDQVKRFLDDLLELHEDLLQHAQKKYPDHGIASNVMQIGNTMIWSVAPSDSDNT